MEDSLQIAEPVALVRARGAHRFEAKRVWLLAVIDVATRCVLIYSLSLQRECSRFDAIVAGSR
ncbi:hypothetical protein DN412_15130 [Cupriavidus lacunae]|uniref:Integrase catalytic domain-containing protein n=1 Tax=Cupriavidus lacunae TaxID=2666307 RepID=A0A370NV82_9BURK|nr:hypothetical protein DN412_15130 [Cupriavidus lacunae]